MAHELQQIEEILKKLEGQDFKRSSIFTNSLLKVKSTTEIIRDVRDEEIVFFQGKKMNEIDYEMINDYGLSNSDQYAKYEMTQLLESESSNIDFNDELTTIISLVNNDEFSDDIDEFKLIFKRVKTIRKIWASSKRNMLDIETNQLLNQVDDKIQMIIDILNNIANLNKELDEQRKQLESIYRIDQIEEPTDD
ncbi:hypothetical protein CANINC_004419 [Pichia inconspicua]|uniref:Uncharacterized protein n=1 Tax=Pichia inconspicua TaxID=52247 RepID=A0A4T0WW85_9ASCO|nr:hypothetical protein CANINC_004419 [[Candida] inconspicua]